MSKIIITGDQHFGVSGRLADILWAARVVDEYADRHGIDLIFSLGDLFHNRSSIDIDILCAVHDFFTRSVARGRRWVGFPGNHDMFLKHSWNINSIKPFGQLMTIIDDVKIVKVDGRRFWILPFIHFESAYMRVLQRIEQQHQDGDVLLTHIGTMGAIKNVCFLLKDWSKVTFAQSKFDRVYTGHFHSPQQVGHNVWYPGSPIPYKADEGDCDHGFLVYDNDSGTHEFVNIWEQGALFFPDEQPPPNYITIADDSITSLRDDELVDLANNNILRVAINTEYSPNEKLDVQTRLNDLGAKEVRWVNLTVQDSTTVQGVVKADDGDIFEAWLKADSSGTKGLQPDVLRRLNNEIKTEGDDRYQAEAD